MQELVLLLQRLRDSAGCLISCLCCVKRAHWPGEGVLPYMSYIGLCVAKRVIKDFEQFGSEVIGYFGLKLGILFGQNCWDLIYVVRNTFCKPGNG